MYKNGHRGLNALLYTPIAAGIIETTNVVLAVIGAFLFVGVARLPDFDRHCDDNMDTHRSDYWEYIPITHRGITHTLWFAILLSPIGALFMIVLGAAYVQTYPIEAFAALGFTLTSLGILSHLAGDSITPTGIRPLAPLTNKKISLGLVNADNKIANYGLLIIGGISLLSVIAWGFNNTNPQTLLP